MIADEPDWAIFFRYNTVLKIWDNASHMALIKCKECGKEISSKAKTCPNCAAPNKKPTSGCTWGCLILIIFLVLIPVSFNIINDYKTRQTQPPTSSDSEIVMPRKKKTQAINQPEKQEKPQQKNSPNIIPKYSIVSTDDVSYATTIRKTYRVSIPKEMTKEELTLISEDIVSSSTIIQNASSQQKINAIMISFYLPDSDTKGGFTGGKAIWAPDGNWDNASKGAACKLIIETGSLYGTVDKKDIVDLPISKKKEIFKEIVRYQDQGMDNNKSFATASKKFGITVDQAEKISIEGAVKDWSMP